MLKVKNFILPYKSVPIVKPENLVKEAIEKMTLYKIGIAIALDDKQKILGILTDGDLRRIMLNAQKPLSAILVEDVDAYLNKKPTVINSDDSVTKAVDLLDKKGHELPVVDKNNIFLGLFQLKAAFLNKLEE